LPADGFALAQFSPTLFAQSDEVGGMREDQVLGFDPEGKNNGYRLSSTGDEEGLASRPG
jgi:hypothetical protein